MLAVGQYTIYKTSNRSEYFLLSGDNGKFYVYNLGELIEVDSVQRDTVILDYKLLPVGKCRNTDFGIGISYDK